MKKIGYIASRNASGGGYQHFNLRIVTTERFYNIGASITMSWQSHANEWYGGGLEVHGLTSSDDVSILARLVKLLNWDSPEKTMENMAQAKIFRCVRDERLSEYVLFSKAIKDPEIYAWEASYIPEEATSQYCFDVVLAADEYSARKAILKKNAENLRTMEKWISGGSIVEKSTVAAPALVPMSDLLEFSALKYA